MKMIRHLLIFFGIYGFLPSLAFEIQRPERPKLISIDSQQTLFCIIFCTCSWTALLKWLPGGHQIFIFSMVILLYNSSSTIISEILILYSNYHNMLSIVRK